MIDSLIRPGIKKLSIVKLPKNSLVFSGLYTLNDIINNENNLEIIESLVYKAKDMRGGYKRISSSLFKNE